MSRTLSGLFLVGAVNTPRRKRTNWENPRRDRETPEKWGKSQKAKKEGQVQTEKPSLSETPCLVALDLSQSCVHQEPQSQSLAFADPKSPIARNFLRNSPLVAILIAWSGEKGPKNGNMAHTPCLARSRSVQGISIVQPYGLKTKHENRGRWRLQSQDP